MTYRRSGAGLLAGLALMITLVVAAPAQAGPLVASAPDCDDATLERPFLPWVDPFRYELAPDGTLEGGGAGWSLAGATVVKGNEPWYVHGLGESYSLRLPAGAAATTPPVCVGLEYPTLRFFARNAGSRLSTLKVEVLFEDAGGRVRSLPVGLLVAGNEWQPTLPLLVVANLLPVLPGDHTAVAFRLTPQGAGDWYVDDLYVDPYKRR